MTTRLTREEIKKETRPQRVSVQEANRNKLFVKGLDNENFYYRWVNDKEHRIQMFLDAGYEFVENRGQDTQDGGVEKSAGTSSKLTRGVGQGVTAYLMRIPKEFWLEDQAKKQAEIDATEADMRKKAREEFTGKLEMGSTTPR